MANDSSAKRIANLEVEVGLFRDAYFQLEKTKRELSRERDFSRSVIDSLPGTLFMVDEKLKTIFWNKVIENICDCSADEIKKMGLAKFFDKADVKQIQAALRQAFRSGQSTVEVRLTNKEGESVPYLFHGARVERDNKPYVIGVGIDISKRKAAEERAKEWDRVRTDFMNVAAHDLRTPATAIKGFASMIRVGDFGPPPEGEMGEALAGMEEGVDRIISLVDDFLTLSRTEQKRFTVNSTATDLAACVKEALQEITLTLGGRQVDLKQEIEDNLPLAKADEDKIVQVLVNLLDNAVKHTAKGKITVQVKHKKAGMLETCVQDTGNGIAPEDLPHVFDRYYRGKQGAVAAGRGAGLGLGLYIVKMIVEKHDGEIGLTSKLGKGTKVCFTLPLYKSRILLVDDDQFVVKLYKKKLVNEGYEVTVANDGSEGLAEAQIKKPDLILLDSKMPKSDGFEMLRELRNSPGLKKIPVVVLTDLWSDQDERRARRLGALDYVVKSNDTLVDRVRKFLPENGKVET